jgi:hypothetical protein
LSFSSFARGASTTLCDDGEWQKFYEFAMSGDEGSEGAWTGVESLQTFELEFLLKRM